MSKPERYRKKWRIRWTDEKGVRRCRSFTSYAQAAKQLKKEESLVAEIKDGLRSRIPEKTFGELSDYYRKNVLVMKSYQRSDISMLKNHLEPYFGDLLLKDIQTHIYPFKAKKVDLHPKTLSNVLTLFVRLLNVAKNIGWLAEVPRVEKPRIRVQDSNFRYLKNDEEFDRFLAAARADDNQMLYFLYGTALYTGMRAGELAGLKWSDIDFETRIITVQRSYDKPTKSGKHRFVPILNPLLPIINEWKSKHPGGDLLFQNTKGGMIDHSGRHLQEYFHRVLKRAGFPEVEINRRKRRYLRFHDLRHSFASNWMRKGGSIFKLQQILGHQDHATTQRYAHLAPTEFAQDHGIFDHHKNGSNLVPFTRRHFENF